MMSARIVTKYGNENHDGNGYLHLDFDKIKSTKIFLEMEIIGISNVIEPIWEIYSNNEQLDINDLTRGKKAELLILKSYSGSRNAPHLFTIIVKDKAFATLAMLNISVYANSKITEAYWGSDTNGEISNADMYTNFTTYFKGFGLYNIPLRMHFYLKSVDDNDIEIPDFVRNIKMITPYDLTNFYVDKTLLKDNKLFFIKNAPHILIDNLSESNKISVTGQERNTVLAYAYFTISRGNEVLFDGKQKNKLLKITIDTNNLFFPEENEISLSPVIISKEQYFTQKYEPCKYEKIFVKKGNETEIEIFDEKKPTQKKKDGTFLNQQFKILYIAPPKESKNIQEVKIRLEKVATDDCSLTDENKQKTIFSEASRTEEELPHKGRVINTKYLDQYEIEYKLTADKQIVIKPTYDYKYGEKEPWQFLKNYFLFSTLLRNTDGIENDIKGRLINWEMGAKELIKEYKIPLESCRYKKNLYLHTIPDVAWAFHALFDDPYIPEYYLFGQQKTIETVRGLETEIDWVKEMGDSFVGNFVATIISPALGSSFVRGFILNILKDIADRYEFGFTAYYDFDKQGKQNTKQIDYAKTNPEVFKALIAGVVTLEILVDLLLIILTEGAALANFLSKAGKVTSLVHKSNSIVRTGKKAEDILKEHSGAFKLGRKGKYVLSKFEFMKGSYFKGYRFEDDKDIGIQPALEERVKISPFLNLKTGQKGTLGELIVRNNPVELVLGGFSPTGFGDGVSRFFLERITTKDKHGKKQKTGKEIAAWFRAIDYPLRIFNKGKEALYSVLSYATDEAVRAVFGAEAEYEKDIIAHMDLDFWLKIHNADQKLYLKHLGKNHITKQDKTSLSIAPSGAFTVRLKLSGNISNQGIIVRAMNMLTWNNKEQTKMQEMNAKGSLEVEGNVFIEKRFYFKADGKPYHQDKIVFTGLVGEYEYKLEASKQKEGKHKIVKKQESKCFMLMEPCSIEFNSSEMTKNPSNND